MDIDEFVKFLDLSEDERLEYYINNPHWNKLHWWENGKLNILINGGLLYESVILI